MPDPGCVTPEWLPAVTIRASEYGQRTRESDYASLPAGAVLGTGPVTPGAGQRDPR
jgi:hypothetical protein